MPSISCMVKHYLRRINCVKLISSRLHAYILFFFLLLLCFLYGIEKKASLPCLLPSCLFLVFYLPALLTFQTVRLKLTTEISTRILSLLESQNLHGFAAFLIRLRVRIALGTHPWKNGIQGFDMKLLDTFGNNSPLSSLVLCYEYIGRPKIVVKSTSDCS